MSSDPPQDWTVSDFVAALHVVIAALELERPHPLGLSWGSVLAMANHDTHPGVASSLLFASAYAGWEGSLPPEEVEQRREAIMEEQSQRFNQLVAGFLESHANA